MKANPTAHLDVENLIAVHLELKIGKKNPKVPQKRSTGQDGTLPSKKDHSSALDEPSDTLEKDRAGTHGGEQGAEVVY